MGRRTAKGALTNFLKPLRVIPMDKDKPLVREFVKFHLLVELKERLTTRLLW